MKNKALVLKDLSTPPNEVLHTLMGAGGDSNILYVSKASVAL
jgi:hypothetical protein